VNAPAAPASSPTLLLCTLLAVIGLVVLVARFKVHAFVALILASLAVGLASPLPLADIVKAFQEGVGNTLGFIAVVVGLGTMLGRLLAESGGAGVVANTVVRALGPARLPLAMVVVAFIVGLPVFFAVGLVLLLPVVRGLAGPARLPLLALGLPLAFGLSASHCLVPPHPGPLAALDRLQANIGATILWASLLGFPAALVVGRFYSRWARRRFPGPAGVPATNPAPATPSVTRPPAFGVAVFTITLPVLLMLLDTVARLTLAPDSPLRTWAAFAGSPLISMTAALLLALWTLGAACGFTRRQLLQFAEDCVGPAAGILLIVGAGGGFSRVLDRAGVADAIAALARGLPLSPLLLGWLVALLIRIATGSATVSITMAAGLMAPVVAQSPGTNRELLVVALGSGSMMASHVNDGGFWFVKEYLNLSVADTLRAWSVPTSLIALLVLVAAVLLDLVF
jgi:GntP family gluconate:H+ symporter